MKLYSLYKSKSILNSNWKIFRKNQKKFSEDVLDKIKSKILELERAISDKDREKSDFISKELEQLSSIHFKKSKFEKIYENFFSLIFALCIAVLIRQVAFELFEIPSGSMRPTFKEQDRLVVSKTQFGINIPLTTSHILFNHENVKRMGVTIFTGENMDIANVKTRYFYLFPGYKQFIKRMVGLPGDMLYFYGGKIYGIDKNGNNITTQLQLDELNYIEHIPFINIEGKVRAQSSKTNDVFSPVTLYQMNIPVAKLYSSSKKDVHYEMLSDNATDLYELWGIENYANARLIKRNTLEHKDVIHQLPVSEFYLELTHHPSISKAKLSRDFYFRMRPIAHLEKSYIPLNESHLQKIWDNIYTGRFIIENGYFRRYGVSAKDAQNTHFIPKLKGDIPNGTYEFYNGKLCKIKSQGVTENLPKDHPLAKFDKNHLFALYNSGIECDDRFIPSYNDNTILPSRYAYFSGGDLYLMGAPIITHDDPVLQQFILSELTLKVNSNDTYHPFIDLGPPLNKDGSLNVEKIKKYGILIPEKQYLVLGDNHAMSADSRDFGFVPENNLRGVPLLMFWAPGGRFGFANNLIYPFFTVTNILIWGTLIIIIGLWYYVNSRKKRIF